MVRLRKKLNIGWIAAIVLCLFLLPFPGRSHAPELHLDNSSSNPQPVEGKTPNSQEQKAEDPSSNSQTGEENNSQSLSEPWTTETSQIAILTIENLSGVGETIFVFVVFTPIALLVLKDRMQS